MKQQDKDLIANIKRDVQEIRQRALSCDTPPLTANALADIAKDELEILAMAEKYLAEI